MKHLLLLAVTAHSAAAWHTRPRPATTPTHAAPEKGSPRAAAPFYAMVLSPGSIEQAIVVDGGLNFLMVYQGLITIRILLSWFPQAQSVAVLQPLFTISDAYLNLFRGVVPPIGGLDISPIGAFFVLNLLSSSVASLGMPAGTRAVVRGPRLPGRQVLENLQTRVRAARESAFA